MTRNQTRIYRFEVPGELGAGSDEKERVGRCGPKDRSAHLRQCRRYRVTPDVLPKTAHYHNRGSSEMNPQHMTQFWWQNWQTRKWAAKEYPLERDYYSSMAAVAQMEYIIYLALEKWKSTV